MRAHTHMPRSQVSPGGREFWNNPSLSHFSLLPVGLSLQCHHLVKTRQTSRISPASLPQERPKVDKTHSLRDAWEPPGSSKANSTGLKIRISTLDLISLLSQMSTVLDESATTFLN